VRPPEGIARRVRAACEHLPEVVEEHPRQEVRWRVRGATLADLRAKAEGVRTISYVTFHARDELPALLAAGPPFYPGWGGGLVAMELTDDDETDWEQLRELLTESYCLLAPKKLSALLSLPEPKEPGPPKGSHGASRKP
jgi:hypothetical protein